MKIGFTAKGSTLDSPMEERFGRTPFFIILDSETEAFEAIHNPLANAGGGVGPKAAQVIIGLGVKALITGQVGGNAQQVLSAAGIPVYTYRNGKSVKDALDMFRANTLEKSG